MSLNIMGENGEYTKVAGNSGGGASSADKISYDNTQSGIEATDVQSAIDTIKAEFYEEITHVNTSLADKISVPKMAEGQIATIGQVLAVKAVNEDGKPTEWEVVENSNNKKSRKAWISNTVELPMYYEYGRSVLVNDELHILNSSGDHFKLFENSWIEDVKAPGRGAAPVVVLNGQIHSFNNGTHYKFNGSSWVTVSTLPYYPINWASAIVFNDEIHILGGDGNTSNKNYTKHYKFNGNSWVSVSTLPVNLTKGVAFILNDTLHIAFGTNIYAYTNNRWNKVTAMTENIPLSIFANAAVVINNELHIFGGEASLSLNDRQSNSHYKFSNGSWVKVSTLPRCFYGGSITVFNDEIHMLGGQEVSTDFYNGSTQITESCYRRHDIFTNI